MTDNVPEHLPCRPDPARGKITAFSALGSTVREPQRGELRPHSAIGRKETAAAAAAAVADGTTPAAGEGTGARARTTQEFVYRGRSWDYTRPIGMPRFLPARQLLSLSGLGKRRTFGDILANRRPSTGPSEPYFTKRGSTEQPGSAVGRATVRRDSGSAVGAAVATNPTYAGIHGLIQLFTDQPLSAVPLAEPQAARATPPDLRQGKLPMFRQLTL